MGKILIHEKKKKEKGVRKILFLFDYLATTGFATVSKNLVSALRDHFGDQLQLSICAINYFGDKFQEDKNTLVFSAVKSAIKKDDFGRFLTLELLKIDDYDGFFVMQDISVITPIVPVLKGILAEKRKENKKQFKSMFYFPVDCRLFSDLIIGLDFFNVIATYTEYGRAEIIRLNEGLRTKIKVIPHGNNNKDFFPVDPEQAQAFRREYFGPENEDKFIVTCVNRNQPRKDISATILGFCHYRDNFNKKAFLYLNLNPDDPMGHNIRAIMKQTDLVEFQDFMLPAKDEQDQGLPVEKLNLVYNASDCFLTTTNGGGWELTVTEAMAACLPVIAPRHTSLLEIGGKNRILFLEEFEMRAHTLDNIIRPHVIVEEVGEKLDILYKEIQGNDLSLRLRISNAKAYVADLEWQTVCRRWIELFEKVFW